MMDLEGVQVIKKSGNKVVIKRADGSTRVCTVNEGVSLTDQSLKNECDVNHILKQHLKTGELRHIAHKQGRFIDVSETPDLLDGLTRIHKAKDLFNALDEKIRKRFKGPVELLEFIGDKDNYDEAVKLGLITETKGEDGNTDVSLKLPGKEADKEADEATSEDQS